MNLAERILDDLEGSEIELKYAVNWYGDLRKLMETIRYLHADGKIHVYINPGRKMLETWEIEDMIRNIEYDGETAGKIRELTIELVWPRV